jgi:hypothetical protein
LRNSICPVVPDFSCPIIKVFFPHTNHFFFLFPKNPCFQDGYMDSHHPGSLGIFFAELSKSGVRRLGLVAAGRPPAETEATHDS